MPHTFYTRNAVIQWPGSAGAVSLAVARFWPKMEHRQIYWISSLPNFVEIRWLVVVLGDGQTDGRTDRYVCVCGRLAVVMTWQKGCKLHIISSSVEMNKSPNSNTGNTDYGINNPSFPLQHVSAFYSVSFGRNVGKRQTNLTAWQNQSHGAIRTAHTTYAAALKTTTHPKTRICQHLFINSTEIILNTPHFNHTIHPLPLSLIKIYGE